MELSLLDLTFGYVDSVVLYLTWFTVLCLGMRFLDEIPNYCSSKMMIMIREDASCIKRKASSISQSFCHNYSGSWGKSIYKAYAFLITFLGRLSGYCCNSCTPYLKPFSGSWCILVTFIWAFILPFYSKCRTFWPQELHDAGSVSNPRLQGSGPHQGCKIHRTPQVWHDILFINFLFFSFSYSHLKHFWHNIWDQIILLKPTWSGLSVTWASVVTLKTCHIMQDF